MITVKATGFEQLRDFCDALGTNMVVVGETVIHRAALKFARAIRRAYETTALDRSRFTLDVYEQGKTKGAWPVRLKYPDAAEMKRTRTMMKSVQVHKETAGHYQVRIRPNTRWPDPYEAAHNRDVAKVAAFLEQPHALQVELTERSQAYLVLLAKGIADGSEQGKGGRSTSLRGVPKTDKKTGKVLAIQWIRRRPIWKDTWLKEHSRIEKEMHTTLKAIVEEMATRSRKRGAKMSRRDIQKYAKSFEGGFAGETSYDVNMGKEG